MFGGVNASLLHRLLVILTCALVLSACGTLEVRIETTPTLDPSAIGTLVSLMYEGTRMAVQVTERAALVTPPPPAGTVRGKVCYPSQNIPAMHAYFRNLETGRLVEMTISTDQSSYSTSLPAGEYYAFAWVPEYQVGGLYSYAVPCGLEESCTDHRPLAFQVEPGGSLENIDLCDWVIPAENLPLAPGQVLPGTGLLPHLEAAG